MHRLNQKLQRTAVGLRDWAKGICTEAKLQFHMALDVIQRLDVAQEHRDLSPQEMWLRAALKRKILGLASIERARKKQASRVTHIREGDANTKFFHLKINVRKRKNTIQRLRKDNGCAVTHGEKESTIHDHFASFMGRSGPRPNELNWEALDIMPADLATLGKPFSEEEVHRAIKEMPADKAPGPDGFTGAFFKACWEIIKEDILLVFNSIFNLRCAHLNLINSANIVLIPKKDGAESVSNYRPISLIHSIAKIFSKLLALRLRPHMHALISVNQSAFIKGRSIHDNFLFVRNMARRYHRLRRAMLLFKLDITKAFDSVCWDYLLALLQQRGFPTRWVDWLGALLSTSTSQVLLNGSPGQRIKHGRGLRQGDPLSPLLFILAIDPLQRILSKATELGVISKLRGRTTRLRISMYADDAVIFINPTRGDVTAFAGILHRFGTATGLVTNLQKSQVAAIRCDNIDLTEVLQGIPAMRANFPLKYLGLPLVLGRMRKTDLQPVFDKISGRVASWRGKNMGAAGRTTLVKSVLSAQPIYLLTALKVTKESLEQLDKQRRRFLWAGTGDITRGKCKVNWIKTCLPTSQGGLGVINLDKFTRALRLRWLWHEWKDPTKPWAGLETPCDGLDKDLFAAATKVTVGDGNTARFWDAAWIDGQRPKDLMPLFYAISKNRRKSLRQGKEGDA